MLDLVSFITQRSYETELSGPTDSVRTQVTAEGDNVIVKKLYDVEGALRRAEFFRSFNRESNGFSRLREFRHVGSIPTHVAINILRKSQGDPLEESRLVKSYLRSHSEFSTVDSVNSF